MNESKPLLMKKIIYLPFVFLLCLLLFSNLCKSQVTIDQVTLKLDSNGWDTAKVRFTSNYGNVDLISSSTFPGQGSSCLNEWVWLVFKGPLDSTSTTIDTSLRIGSFGFLTKYFRLQADLDTSSSPLPPSPRIPLDTFIYDNCFITSLEETNQHKEVLIYPNPNKGVFRISKALSETFELTVFNLQGKKLKEYKSNQESYDISDLAKGVYIISIQSEKERFIKKVIIN